MQTLDTGVTSVMSASAAYCTPDSCPSAMAQCSAQRRGLQTAPYAGAVTQVVEAKLRGEGVGHKQSCFLSFPLRWTVEIMARLKQLTASGEKKERMLPQGQPPRKGEP